MIIDGQHILVIVTFFASFLFLNILSKLTNSNNKQQTTNNQQQR